MLDSRHGAPTDAIQRTSKAIFLDRKLNHAAYVLIYTYTFTARRSITATH